MSRSLLNRLSEPVLKAVALRWFMLGFALSGRGFHGEATPPTRAGVRTLLAAEFHRQWGLEAMGRDPRKRVNDRPHPDDRR